MWDYLTYIGGHKITILGFSFGLDKIFHISSILIIGFFILFFLTKLNIKSKLKFIIIGISLVFVSVFKEIFDLYWRKTYFSLEDIAADIIGIILFIILIFLYSVFKNKKRNYKI